MKDLAQAIRSCSGRDLEERKHWYSPAAEAYNKARPRYPQALVQQVIEIAQLSSQSTLLEVGCGPGTATVAFAELGCTITCLEPNPDFYAIALQNCRPYPRVSIQSIFFEEWQPEGQTFHVAWPFVITVCLTRAYCDRELPSSPQPCVQN